MKLHTPTAALALAASLAGCSVPAESADDALALQRVPAELAPPPGSEELLRTGASGVQIYGCERGEDGEPAWTLIAPDAVLETAEGFFASHGAGPSWTARDGSRVLGRKLADAPSPDGESIDWLLLEATPQGGGTFESTRSIQRVDTRGGAAPDDGCSIDTIGQEIRSPYSAAYVFFGTSP